jgi:TonB-linked SusC/RagA family outer membrane protein
MECTEDARVFSVPPDLNVTERTTRIVLDVFSAVLYHLFRSCAVLRDSAARSPSPSPCASLVDAGMPGIDFLEGATLMKFGRWRLSAVVLAACALGIGATRASAQGSVTGRVTAQGSNQPLAEARVLVIGGTTSATTNEDGKFTIHNLPVGAVQLQVLRVGYQSQKKTVTIASNQTATADFVVGVAIATLEEVVTTATGQQRKVELGNAISTLGDVGKRVSESEISNVTDLMIAKSPGVSVLPSPVLGGAPTLRIRGISSISLSNAPIWVVDGVRYNTNNPSNSSGQTPVTLLNNLSPEEIEDIEIVKGPSAATLYGTNAANGVIVITTKKGKAGASHWNWTAETRTIDDRTHYQAQYANFGHSPLNATKNVRCQLPFMVTPAFPYKVLTDANGKQTLDQNFAQCVADSLSHYDPFSDPAVTMVGLGRGSLFGSSVSGGTDAVRFFTSANVDNEFGPIKMPAPDIRYYQDSLHTTVSDAMLHPRNQQKINFRTNLSAAVSPTLDLTANAGFGKSDNAIEPDNSLLISTLYLGQANYGYKGCPGNKTPCGLDKPYADQTGFPLNGYNSFAPGSVMQFVTPVDVQRTTGSFDANWRPLTWLQNEGTIGIDLAMNDAYHICRLNECPQSGATSRIGNVSDSKQNFRNLSGKLASTASWQARNWINLKTSIGGDYTNSENDQTSASGRGLPPGGSTLGATSTFVNYSSTQPTAVKTLGYYAQEQAAINDRLFLTVAARQDQNSAFGSNFQSIVYPKASISWILSDESFFPRIGWLNSFRLRSAYGANGVQPGATAALQTFQAATTSLAKVGTTTGTDTPGLLANNPGNADLKPETSSEFEGGFESDVLSHRLHIDYTFYDKRTTNALISVPIASSNGSPVTSLLQNVGSTLNWGHELQANAQIFDTKRFGWDVTLSASHNSNKWIELGVDPSTGVERIIGAGLTTEQRQGYPLNSQWYKSYSWADKNNDHVIQQSEVTVDTARFSTGYNVPRDIVSIQNGVDLFSHKLRVTAMFDYRGGGNTVDGTNGFDCTSAPQGCQENMDKTAPLWMQARAVAATLGTVVNGTSQKTTLGYYMTDQFWKFRELSVIYTLPVSVVRLVRGQSGSTLVFGARNLHTWSTFTGLDPEANYGVSGSENQNEFNTAPQPTYFTLRLNLKY